jgi:hypothetical protein
MLKALPRVRRWFESSVSMVPPGVGVGGVTGMQLAIITSFCRKCVLLVASAACPWPSQSSTVPRREHMPSGAQTPPPPHFCVQSESIMAQAAEVFHKLSARADEIDAGVRRVTSQLQATVTTAKAAIAFREVCTWLS